MSKRPYIKNRRPRGLNVDRGTYRSWCSMKQRCRNPRAPNFVRYGGRGITVCERWALSFDAFLQDMGVRPAGTTLERLDCNGNYEPSNCVWAGPLQQQRNRSSVKLKEKDADEIRSSAEPGAVLAARFGVSQATVSMVRSGKRWNPPPLLRKA